MLPAFLGADHLTFEGGCFFLQEFFLVLDHAVAIYFMKFYCMKFFWALWVMLEISIKLSCFHTTSLRIQMQGFH